MPSPAEVFKCLADETRVRATLLIVDQGAPTSASCRWPRGCC
ncbi:hypothetical protein ACLBWF_15260, partial [Pseudomonas aeruginosa]